jgi:dinuclear metal center YbgI/SA1388 family protein
MAVLLSSLVEELNTLLSVDSFKDYGPNGLQVQGRADVRVLVTGVTACRALIEEAIALKADALLVHHGLFWGGDPLRVSGILQQRLKRLLQADITLLAYHLPLDAHDVYGNNVLLAEKMGWVVEGPLLGFMTPDIGCVGHIKQVLSPDAFKETLSSILHNPVQHIAAAPKSIKRIAWCTGAAEDGIVQAAAQGVDAYISGEISERTVYLARELGLHYFAAGHHATERYGVQALGEMLALRHDLKHHYVELDNPI